MLKTRLLRGRADSGFQLTHLSKVSYAILLVAISQLLPVGNSLAVTLRHISQKVGVGLNHIKVLASALKRFQIKQSRLFFVLQLVRVEFTELQPISGGGRSETKRFAKRGFSAGVVVQVHVGNG